MHGNRSLFNLGRKATGYSGRNAGKASIPLTLGKISLQYNSETGAVEPIYSLFAKW
jgi:hypothetical protein